MRGRRSDRSLVDPTLRPTRRHALSHATARSEIDRPSTPWRMLAAIDLHGGDRVALADRERIRAVVRALVDALGLRARGQLGLERFADAELEGWSAIELTEEPSFMVHVGKVG